MSRTRNLVCFSIALFFALGLFVFGLMRRAVFAGSTEQLEETGSDTVALDGDEVEPDPPDPFTEHQMATWTTTTSGNLVLELSTGPTSETSGTPTVEAEVLFVLRLGPYSERWTQGPYLLTPGTAFQVVPEIPAPTTVHDLASTFGADLYGEAAVGAYSGRFDTVSVVWSDSSTSSATISASLPEDQGFDADQVSAAIMERISDHAAAGRRVLPDMGVSHRGREDTGFEYYYHGLEEHADLEE